MSIASFILRAAFLRSDNRRDAGLKTPEAVLRNDNIQYGPDAVWNLLDVYRPKGATETLPVIVSIHGGGWVYGDKERYQYYCMSLAEKGFAVVNFTYRLAPKHKFPAPLEDTNAVFTWVFHHADSYGFDLKRIFAVGDSAGANLLALYSCICANPDYAKQFSFAPPAHFIPRAIALNCGVYSVQKSDKKSLTSWLLKDYLPGKGTEEELETISVLNHVTASFPPSFVMTSEGDFLAAEAPPLAARLRELQVPVEYRYYGGPGHVLGHVFHCNIRSADAQRCNEDECGFFIRSYSSK